LPVCVDNAGWTGGKDCTFIAGTHYKINTRCANDFYGYSGAWTVTGFFNHFGHEPLDTDYLLHFTPDGFDVENYYLSEFPMMVTTFPPEDAQIAGAFNIQGSYSIPDASNYNKLTAYVGRGIPYYQYNFTQELTEKTGNVDIRISGVLEGSYSIQFVFSGGGESSYFSDTFTIQNIDIVVSIPPELPDTQEVPPDVFSGLLPQYIYVEYSNYATSTALFDALTGAIKPLVLVIGDNLTFFSSQFNQENAKDAGEKAGSAVLLVRSYAGNINSFFNDLPVSEILFLYLSALVAVIVFRIIRLLLKLIPFT
jgi:hypothetical protein